MNYFHETKVHLLEHQFPIEKLVVAKPAQDSETTSKYSWSEAPLLLKANEYSPTS